MHEGVFPPAPGEELTQHQQLLTLHIYNTIQALLRRLVFEDGDALATCNITAVLHWCMRFEFQKRGTIHVHVLCWIEMSPTYSPESLTGRSNQQHDSLLVRLLEAIFRCSVDVQGGKCSANLFKYVLGYVAKASDALQFRSASVFDVRVIDAGPFLNIFLREVFCELCCGGSGFDDKIFRGLFWGPIFCYICFRRASFFDACLPSKLG